MFTLGAPNEYPPLEVARQVYRGRYDNVQFGVGRLTDRAGLPVGPAGLGVDDSGAVHIADGARQRVLVVDPDGNIDVADYTALGALVFQGFTAAPDGTHYITLNDGLAIGHGGQIATRLSASELGWDGIYRSPRASPRGVWVSQPTSGAWTLVADESGKVITGVTSASDSRPDVAPQRAVRCEINSLGTLSVAIGSGVGKTATVSTPAGVAGALACTLLDDGTVLVVLVDAAHLANLLVVTIGSAASSIHRIDIPEENMLLNGPYVVVGSDNCLYIETGSLDEVSVSAYQTTTGTGS